MSHHLDTPLTAKTGQLYIDDLYVFPGQDSTVLIMDVNSNVNCLHSEPGFHPEARYEIKVHFDGADFGTLTHRVSFADPDPTGQHTLRLHILTGGQAREDSAADELILTGQTGQTASDDELAEAAARARLLDWVTLLPCGWDTQVGTHGAALSGGQRQRLGLARALLAGPSCSSWTSPLRTWTRKPAGPDRRPAGRDGRPEHAADHPRPGRPGPGGRDRRPRPRPGGRTRQPRPAHPVRWHLPAAVARDIGRLT